MANTNRREKGTGCIRKRKDGRWEANIQIGVDENGKAIKKYFYASTEREAKKKIKEYQIELARGIEEVSKLTLSTYVQNYLKTYKLHSVKASTYDRMESTFIHHVKNTIGYIQMGNINSNDIQILINEKSLELSYSSVKKIVELLNPVFKHAFTVGDIQRNPMLAVVMPKKNQMPVQTKKIGEYTEEEIASVINVVNTTFDKKKQLYRYSPIYVFILNTGIRAGEALALTWDKVDLDKKIVIISNSMSMVKNRTASSDDNKRKIIISDTKTTNGNRIIPLNSKAIDALKEIQRRNEQQHITSEYVVCDLNGNHLTPRNFQRTWENIANRANIKNQGIHALRHTFGSRALRTGIEIKVVSELLGHATVAITYNRYIHILQEQKVQAVKLLEAL